MRRASVLMVATAVVLSLTVVGGHAGDFKVPLGLSYVSGVGDITDIYETNLEAEGYSVNSVDDIPVGLFVHPYYEWDCGVGVGFGLGPIMMIIGDAFFIDVPLGVDVRVSLPSRFKVSPYVFTGVRVHLATGDYVEDTVPGIYGGVGVSFMRNRGVGMGIEVGFDTSSIELETQDTVYGSWGSSYTVRRLEEVEPMAVTVSLYATL